jgi:hypothetical protein
MSPSHPDQAWAKVQALLLDAALLDPLLDRYGDLIHDKLAIERFLKAHKGDVRQAFEQMKAHLHWRNSYKVDSITDEDFSDMKARGELYWTGHDKNGVPTLTWILSKHDGGKQSAERFVRFLVYQIECGMRSLPSYPNTEFNIMVDLTDVGFGNNDPEMIGLLQSTLVQNYPKVRKGLYVFPVNWFVHLFWDTIIKPILSTLQPDIEDKIIPLKGDYEAELRSRFDVDQIEVTYGGKLDLTGYPTPAVLPYCPTSLKSIANAKAQKAIRERTASISSQSSAASSTTMKACQKLARAEISERHRKAAVSHRKRGVRSKSSSSWASYGKLWWATLVIATGSLISTVSGDKAGLLTPLVSAAGLGFVSWKVLGGQNRDGKGGSVGDDDEVRTEVNILQRVKAEAELLEGKETREGPGSSSWAWATRFAQCSGF